MPNDASLSPALLDKVRAQRRATDVAISRTDEKTAARQLSQVRGAPSNHRPPGHVHAKTHPIPLLHHPKFVCAPVMAFFAAGVFKGAQYVKREVKKSNQRNALIVADDTVPRDSKTLSVQKDWWVDDASDSASHVPIVNPPDSRDATVPQVHSHRSDATVLDEEDEEEPLPRPPSPPMLPTEAPADATVLEAPANSTLPLVPANAALLESSAPVVTRGSYAERLQARRDAPPFPLAAPSKRSVSYAEQMHLRGDALSKPMRPAVSKDSRPRAVPGSFSAAVESGELPLASVAPAPPSRSGHRQPRKDTQPSGTSQRSSVPSGSFAEALQLQQKAAKVEGSTPRSTATKGSFLEATQRTQAGGSSWNDFIRKTAAQGEGNDVE